MTVQTSHATVGRAAASSRRSTTSCTTCSRRSPASGGDRGVRQVRAGRRRGSKQLFQELARDDTAHAERLVEALARASIAEVDLLPEIQVRRRPDRSEAQGEGALVLGVPGHEIGGRADSSVPRSRVAGRTPPPDVAAASASVTVIPSRVAPRPMTSGIAPKPPNVPALASLARATVAPASMSARAGGMRSRSTSAGAGRSVATVSRAARAPDAVRIQLLEVVDRCRTEPHAELRGAG